MLGPLAMRPYQEEAITALREAYRRGARRLLIVLATGTGKTALAAEIARRARVGPTHDLACIFIAHRDTLLEQADRAFSRQITGARIGYEQGPLHGSPSDHAIFASIASCKPARRRKLFDTVGDRLRIMFVDEAHRTAAATYRAFLDELSERFPDVLVIGLTATPERGDGVGMADLYDEICYEFDVRTAISEGYLVEPESYRVETRVVLDGVEVRSGDYVSGELSKAVNIESRNKVIVDAMLMVAKGKRSLVFASSVDHVRSLTNELCSAGIRAEGVWGDMSDAEKNACYARYRSGQTQALVSCDLLIEGADFPFTECLALGRPTKSRGVYQQMLGRGFRPSSDVAGILGELPTAAQRRGAIASSRKKKVIVIDVVDQSRGHSVHSIPTLFGLEAPAPLPVGEHAPRDREEREVPAGLRVIGMSLSNIDILAAEKTLKAADTSTMLTWITPTPGSRMLRLPPQVVGLTEHGERVNEFQQALRTARKNGSEDPIRDARAACPTVKLVPSIHVRYEITMTSPGHWSATSIEDGVVEFLGHDEAVGNLVRLCERRVRERFPGAWFMLDRNAIWRKKPPSEDQIAALRVNGFPVPETRGEASEMLGRVSSRNKSLVAIRR